jgi:hypothetical protein
MSLVLVCGAAGVIPCVQAQTADEVKRLTADIEDLRKQLTSLEKENELLKRELELQKRETKAAIPDGARQPNSGAEPLAPLLHGGSVAQLG